MFKPLIPLLGLIVNLAMSASPDLVIALNRHGGRAPLLNTFDLDNYWGSNITLLTENGKRMGYLLGRAYQEDYPELLSSYDPDKIYVRSSDSSRTIQTAQAILAGIFNGSLEGTDFPESWNLPPYNQPGIDEVRDELDNSNASLSTAPKIKINTVSVDDDVVIKNNEVTACPANELFFYENVIASQTSEIYQTYMQDLVQYLKTQNVRINSSIDLYFFGDTVTSNYYADAPLPANIDPNSTHFRDAIFAYQWLIGVEYIGHEKQKVNGVYLLKSIIDIMNRSIEGTSPLEFVIYSGHDNTLLSILSPFGLVTLECLVENYKAQTAGSQIPYEDCIYPVFVSNIKFELYKGTTPRVKFFYNDVEIPLCDNAPDGCTFSQFQDFVAKALNNYTTADYDRICSRDKVDDFDQTVSAHIKAC